jgi:hypothetical protein
VRSFRASMSPGTGFNLSDNVEVGGDVSDFAGLPQKRDERLVAEKSESGGIASHMSPAHCCFGEGSVTMQGYQL